MDTGKICFNCFREIENGDLPCPHCGFPAPQMQNPPNHLRCGTLLAGKYLIGRSLGQGGFGITYVGWDLNLDLKIAVKEYYPDGFASRELTMQSTVLPHTGGSGEFFEKGRSKFVEEARVLARFTNLPGVVTVRDYFTANGTAYIVMEYLDGRTLKEISRERGKMPAAEVLGLLEPLFSSLEQVHAAGLLHRDISPDNIIVKRDGGAKLLDFGAARQFSTQGEKSNTINVKHGFAPEEQYRTRGEQGPWTDIYALCATIYSLTTGVLPPQALDRLAGEPITPPNALGANFTPPQQASIMRGLSIRGGERQQNIGELFRELYGGMAPQPSAYAAAAVGASSVSPGGSYGAPGGAYTSTGGAYTSTGGAYTSTNGSYTPPAGGPGAPSGSYVPPAGFNTPPGGGYTPPGGGYAPPGGGYTPPGGGYTPPGGGYTPPGGGYTPPGGGYAPPGGGYAPPGGTPYNTGYGQAAPMPPGARPAGGKSRLPIILGAVAGVAVLAISGILLLARGGDKPGDGPSAFATPTVTISAAPSPTPTPRPTPTPTPTPTPAPTPTPYNYPSTVNLYPESLRLAYGESQTIDVSVENPPDGEYTVRFDIDDESVVSASWGEWYDTDALTLTLSYVGDGESNVDITVYTESDGEVYGVSTIYVQAGQSEGGGDGTLIDESYLNQLFSGFSGGVEVIDITRDTMYWSDGDEDSVAVSALVNIPILAACADAIDSGSLAMSDGLLFGYTTATRGGGIPAASSGQYLSLAELLKNMLWYSDNNVSNSLFNYFTFDTLNSIYSDAGFSSFYFSNYVGYPGDNYGSAYEIAVLLRYMWEDTSMVISHDYLLENMVVMDGYARVGLGYYIPGDVVFLNHNGVKDGVYAEAAIVDTGTEEFIIVFVANGGSYQDMTTAAANIGDYVYACLS